MQPTVAIKSQTTTTLGSFERVNLLVTGTTQQDSRTLGTFFGA
jgi:hypothetical protein